MNTPIFDLTNDECDAIEVALKYAAANLDALEEALNRTLWEESFWQETAKRFER